MLQENSVFNQTCLLMPNSRQTLLVWNLYELNVWYRDHFLKIHLVMCNLFLMKTLLPFVLKICTWNYVVDFFKKSEAVMWNGVGIQCVTITRHCKLLLIQALRNCFQESSILLLPSCYQSSAAGNESLFIFSRNDIDRGNSRKF